MNKRYDRIEPVALGLGLSLTVVACVGSDPPGDSNPWASSFGAASEGGEAGEAGEGAGDDDVETTDTSKDTDSDPGDESGTSGASDPSGGDPDTGNGDDTGGSDPVDPIDGCPAGVNGLNSGGGAFYGCALTPDGGAACWQNPGGPAQPLTYNDGSPLTGAVQAVAGSGHGCVLLDTGAVHCWGNPGQTGNGASTPPLQVSSDPTIPTGAVALSAGLQHTCALVEEGGRNKAVCWGDDGNGQLGDGPGPGSGVVDVMLAPEDHAIALYASYHHGCVALADGGMKCWGENTSGQLGDGQMGGNGDVPVAVSGLPGPVVAVAAGRNHSCALVDNGALYCWGDNFAGQTGLSSDVFNTTMPTDAAASSGVVEIAGGRFHTVALHGDGTVEVFGQGQVQANGVSAIASGHELACLARGDGTVACWNNKQDGTAMLQEVMSADGSPLMLADPECNGA